MNPRIGLSRQADNCATPGTFVMATNGPINWQAPWVGTYYVCFGYTDDNGVDMYMDLGLSVELFSKTPGLTTVAAPTVYRGRPTAVDVSDIVSPSTAVFRASQDDSVTLCNNPSFSVPLTWVPHPNSNDGLLVVDISPADTAINNAVCFFFFFFFFFFVRANPGRLGAMFDDFEVNALHPSPSHAHPHTQSPQTGLQTRRPITTLLAWMMPLP